MTTAIITILISKRHDNQYVTQLTGSADGPLGIDFGLDQAIGSAVREATRIGLEHRCRVAIDIEQANGRVRRYQIVNSPLQINRKPRPATETG